MEYIALTQAELDGFPSQTIVARIWATAYDDEVQPIFDGNPQPDIYCKQNSGVWACISDYPPNYDWHTVTAAELHSNGCRYGVIYRP